MKKKCGCKQIVNKKHHSAVYKCPKHSGISPFGSIYGFKWIEWKEHNEIKGGGNENS